MRPRLRLYNGESEHPLPEPPPITVRLGDVNQILRDAISQDRTWLEDFEEEEIQISPDLYEVLCAYWQMRTSA